MASIKKVKALDQKDNKVKLFDIAADIDEAVVAQAVTDYLEDKGIGMVMQDGLVKLGGE